MKFRVHYNQCRASSAIIAKMFRNDSQRQMMMKAMNGEEKAFSHPLNIHIQSAAQRQSFE
jgi:hypothetical protein